MNKRKWEIKLSIYFISISIIIYAVHYLVYNKLTYIIDNFILQLAFLPIYVLLSTVIIDQLLNYRERNAILKKVYMIVGVFYSEVGYELLKFLKQRDNFSLELNNYINISGNWTDKDFKNTIEFINKYKGKVKISLEDIQYLKKLFIQKREFLLNIISNPSLVENEIFTELLLATFHLSDEVIRRDKIEGISLNDIEHLNLDAERAYLLLMRQWVIYMKHLKKSYPYLFSLAVTTNPFLQ